MHHLLPIFSFVSLRHLGKLSLWDTFLGEQIYEVFLAENHVGQCFLRTAVHGRVDCLLWFERGHRLIMDQLTSQVQRRVIVGDGYLALVVLRPNGGLRSIRTRKIGRVSRSPDTRLPVSVLVSRILSVCSLKSIDELPSGPVSFEQLLSPKVLWTDDERAAFVTWMRSHTGMGRFGKRKLV